MARLESSQKRFMDHQKLSWSLFPPQHGLTNTHDKLKRKRIDILRLLASERDSFLKTCLFAAR